MEDAANAMGRVAQAIANAPLSIAKFQTEYPKLAKIAGGAAIADGGVPASATALAAIRSLLFGGTALKGSALALTAAAEKLAIGEGAVRVA